MKAEVYRSYGPPEVLKIVEVEQPCIQDGHDDRVLIKVHSASVNPIRLSVSEGISAHQIGQWFYQTQIANIGHRRGLDD